MGYFRLYPGQLFVFLTGPPAVKKSTAIEIASRFLSEFKDISITSGKLSTQGLIDVLESQPILNGSQLQHSDSITFIKAGELANFIPKQSYIEEIIPFLTDAYDAREGEWVYRTRSTGETTIRNVLVTFLAGTTPDWLFNNIPESAWGGGFMSRVLMVHQPDCDRINPIPVISAKAKRLKVEIITEMFWLANRLNGQFVWTTQARRWYDVWYRHFKGNQPRDLVNTMGHYLARKPVNLLKIAMIVAILQTRALVLTQKALETAEKLFIELEIFLPDLLDKKTVSNPIAEQCQNVLDFMRGKSTVSRGDLLKGLWRKGLNAAAIDLVLDTLLQAELVEVFQVGNRLFYRLHQPK